MNRPFLSRPFVGSEHLLLGLMRADRRALWVLVQCGVTIDAVREAAKKLTVD